MSAALTRLVTAPPKRACFVAAILGDALAQHISARRDGREWRYDWVRTARLALFNGLFMGPLGHFYYQALDVHVGAHAMTAPSTIAKKLLIDQLAFAPICERTLLMPAGARVRMLADVAEKGRRAHLHLLRELADKFVPTMVANYKLWPAAHIINFAFVPPSQRILYANCVSVLGTYVLSRAAAGDYSKKKTGGLHPERLPRGYQADEVLFDGVNIVKQK
eukprot:scaffold12.g8154.t1